jgi:peptide/nickel transport system substrate-binding protein
MRRSLRSTRWLAAVVVAVCAATAAVLAAATPAAVRTGESAGTPRAASAHRCLTMTGSGDVTFIKNFNPFTATGLPSGQFIQGSFYEGLIVTGEGGLKPVPWLARSWKWSNGNRTLTLNLTHNAKWSDGKRLTSADVVYSITAGRQDKLMDRVGLTAPGNNIKSVVAKGAYKVAISLRTPDSQFIAAILNRVFIVPKHIWSKVRNVATFTNPHPVGSGPFNVVSRFNSQDYVFGKNRHYWQKGLPHVACLDYVQAASNDAALALIQSGQVDWTHNFVPNVAKAYTNRDKAHYHAFYATTAYPVSIVLDTSKYPYSITAFRKAISLAVDRRTVSKLGEYGYAPPTDALGLGFLFPQWVTDAAVKRQAKAMAAYNPAAAKKLLTGAGFTYKGNNLYDPHGNRVNLDMHVISGWSDWVASDQIITRNLRAIGIDSNVALEPDWGAWSPNAFAGKFPTLLWQGGSQGSPYGYFYANMSRNAYIAPGQDASSTGNWEHYANGKATTLLSQWKVSLSQAKQRRLATQLEKLWLQQLPIVPVFVGPRWSTYSTKYFHNFDTPQNFWGDPIFTTFPDNILSFTRIKPGGKAGA